MPSSIGRTAARQRLHIAAIGPLTNIALLAHHFPECLANIDEMVIVAGRSPDGVFTSASRARCRISISKTTCARCRCCSKSHIPMVFAGFELTSQVVITTEDLATIAARGTKAARYLHDNSLAWFNHWTEKFPSERGFHPWDSAAIAWLTHRELFTTETRHVRILPREEKRAAWLECDVAGDGLDDHVLHGVRARWRSDVRRGNRRERLLNQRSTR